MVISICGGLYGLIVVDEEEYLIEFLYGGFKGFWGLEESGLYVVYKCFFLCYFYLDMVCGVRDEKLWKGWLWWLWILKLLFVRFLGNEIECG